MTDSPAAGLAEEMKPCPFCGNDAAVKKINHPYWDRCILCTVCCCKTGEYSSGNKGHMDAMYAAWNRRAPAQEATPTMEGRADVVERTEVVNALKRLVHMCTCGSRDHLDMVSLGDIAARAISLLQGPASTVDVLADLEAVRKTRGSLELGPAGGGLPPQVDLDPEAMRILRENRRALYIKSESIPQSVPLTPALREAMKASAVLCLEYARRYENERNPQYAFPMVHGDEYRAHAAELDRASNSGAVLAQDTSVSSGEGSWVR